MQIQSREVEHNKMVLVHGSDQQLDAENIKRIKNGISWNFKNSIVEKSTKWT